ncbi:MAG: AIR synthase-related protein, partial [Coriobacteriales bacterium]
LVRRAITDRASDDYLTQRRPELEDRSLLDALLMPTRIYVPSVQAVREAGLPVHALAHITGGGITENLDRALPDGLDAVVERGSWDNQSVIEFVMKAAELSEEQAYKTFNMGIGMAVICAPEDAGDIARVLEEHDERVWRIGAIEPSADGGHATGKVVYR